jgi:hypothetical protein
MDLANRMQRYYSENNTFASATIAAGVPATDVWLQTFAARLLHSVIQPKPAAHK